MAGRTKIPKGAAAEEELRRQRRNEQRKKRHRKRKIQAMADEAGITFEEAELRLLAEERGNPDPITKAPSASPTLDLSTLDSSEIPEELLTPPTFEEMQRNLMTAFHGLGGVEGLMKWGQKNPKDFYALWGRYCLPDPDDAGSGSDGESLEAIISRIDNTERTVN